MEAGSLAPQVNDDTLLGWEDYQRGQVALIFSTLFASPQRFRTGDWDQLVYSDSQQAHRLYSSQIDAYERLMEEHPDKFQLVFTRQQLNQVLSEWQQPAEETFPAKKSEQGTNAGRVVGLVLLMEGAEGVRHPSELEWWWQRGIRIIGPAWAGTRYCGGTHEPGALTSEGISLLEGMAELGFALDVSHMDEKAALQALDRYPGQIIASHSNASVPFKEPTDSNRHLSERLVHGLVERDAVIGTVIFNSFLKPSWRRGDQRDEVKLDRLIAQIDYICQVAGNAWHVAIGSDADGGFGLQRVPAEIDTIADLRKLIPLLEQKGYSDKDIEAILGMNWVARLEKILK